jgi:hypothetical protein
MKTQEELKKLTTQRLLNYYRAERKRMFRQGFRYDENDGWVGRNSHTLCGRNFTDVEASEQIEYLLMVQLELNSRENI